MTKPMLKVNELIEYMKKKGILFTIITEEEANRHLSAHNNYFKLTSYRKNYTKYSSGPHEGEYEQLEFAYLRELARLDTEIRQLLLNMALDIEHFLKVALIKAVEDRLEVDGEDGYKVVKDFLEDTENLTASHHGENNTRPFKSKIIMPNKHNPYCGGLISNYNDAMPIWVFVELISFGNLLALVKYYAAHSDWDVPIDMKSLDRVRQIRNACAHGNGIINDLRPYQSANGKSDAPPYISRYVYSSGISKKAALRKLSNPRISQIVHMLYTYDKLVTSPHTRGMRLKQLNELMNTRCLEYREYFNGNMLLTSTYSFFKKLTDSIK